MRSPSDLREIALCIEHKYPGQATELRSFADFLEDLDAAKARKLAMQAELPPDRARLLQQTIAFHQNAATAAEARGELLEGALKLALVGLRQAVDAIQGAINPHAPRVMGGDDAELRGPNNEPAR